MMDKSHHVFRRISKSHCKKQQSIISCYTRDKSVYV